VSQPATIAQHRQRYADFVTHTAGVTDPRIRFVFANLPREDFLPPGPWTIISQGVAVRSPDADPAHVYDNVLVALDRERGINNGEPVLHAAWLDSVQPKPGETVVHVGAGTGYYTAMLAMLVDPGGQVHAYEVHESLARQAARNLSSFPSVTVHEHSAIGRKLPPADIIYVNAGVVAPDAEWLRALNPTGRLIFPWQPVSNWGDAVLVTRMRHGFRAVPIMRAGFITCTGEEIEPTSSGRPGPDAVSRTRSVWLTVDRPPDHTATAIYPEVWFSAEEIDGHPAR